MHASNAIGRLEFKNLGRNKCAYIRKMPSTAAQEFVPNLPRWPNDPLIYVVFHANGDTFAYGLDWTIVMEYVDDEKLSVVTIH